MVFPSVPYLQLLNAHSGEMVKAAVFTGLSSEAPSFMLGP